MRKLINSIVDFIDSDTFLIYVMSFGTLGMALAWCLAMKGVI